MTTKVASHFVGLLFLSRDVAHKLHLATESYAQHKALNEFYDGIVDLADTFAEQYQGCYEELLDIPFLSSKDDSVSIDDLKAVLKWLKANREKICPRSETSLQNVLDEVEGLFHSTFYKLKFLK